MMMKATIFVLLAILALASAGRLCCPSEDRNENRKTPEKSENARKAIGTQAGTSGVNNTNHDESLTNGKKTVFEAEAFVQFDQAYIRKSPMTISELYAIAQKTIHEIDLPFLDAGKLGQIFDWLNGQDTEEVLNTKFDLSIKRRDIQTLNPLAWLNDNIIEFYMGLLRQRSLQNGHWPKVHTMSTFFMQCLKDKGYNGVRRWTRNVNIFSFEIILVPVNTGNHWCMAVIDMRYKTIKYYDSLGYSNNLVLNALIVYLNLESSDKIKKKFDFTGWTPENVKNIPQQENASDCGVFICMYAEFITRNRPIVFTQQHMEYYRLKMIYEICTGQLLN